MTKSLRIGVLSPAPWMPSGYGVQAAYLLRGLRALGYECASFSFTGLNGAPLAWEGFPVYPRLFDYMGQDMAAHARNFRADLVIPVMDIWTLEPALWKGVRLAPWFPVDHEPLSPAIVTNAAQCAHPIVYSQFGQRVCADAGVDVAYIPCMVNTEIFSPRPRTEARAALGWPQDRCIVGMVAANASAPSRKAFYQQLRAFALFHQEYPDTLLYLHTFLNTGCETDGENLALMLDRVGLRIDEDVFVCDQYQYLLGFPASYMATAYSGMDVLLACAMGEGFCVPLVEAQACGTPVICGDWTAMPELCFAGWRVQRASVRVYDRIVFDDASWGQLGGCKVYPRVSAIVEALDMAYRNWGNTRLGEQARAGALAYDVRTVMREYWGPFLEAVAY